MTYFVLYNATYGSDPPKTVFVFCGLFNPLALELNASWNVQETRI